MAEQSRNRNEKQLKSLLPVHWNYHMRAVLLSPCLVSIPFLLPAPRAAEVDMAASISTQQTSTLSPASQAVEGLHWARMS